MSTKAQYEAESLVEDFELDIPIVPERVCEAISTASFKVNYREEEFSTPNLCGISIGYNDEVTVVVNSQIHNNGRKLFTCAHEIGHVVLHIQEGVKSEFRCTESDIKGQNNADFQLEREANEFASRLIMPSSHIDKIVRRSDISWQLIQNISDQCSSSLEATARRLVQCATEACALIIHKDDEMWTPIKSKAFSGYIESFYFPKQLTSYSHGSSSLLPSEFDECEPSMLFPNFSDSHKFVRYSSIFNREYNKRMTLIVVPDYDNEEDDDDIWDEPSF